MPREGATENECGSSILGIVVKRLFVIVIKLFKHPRLSIAIFLWEGPGNTKRREDNSDGRSGISKHRRA